MLPALDPALLAGRDCWRADVSLSGNLYKLWNRPRDVLPIVPKEL
jgi:hypothetical protein